MQLLGNTRLLQDHTSQLKFRINLLTSLHNFQLTVLGYEVWMRCAPSHCTSFQLICGQLYMRAIWGVHHLYIWHAGVSVTTSILHKCEHIPCVLHSTNWNLETRLPRSSSPNWSETAGAVSPHSHIPSLTHHHQNIHVCHGIKLNIVSDPQHHLKLCGLIFESSCEEMRLLTYHILCRCGNWERGLPANKWELVGILCHFWMMASVEGDNISFEDVAEKEVYESEDNESHHLCKPGDK